MSKEITPETLLEEVAATEREIQDEELDIEENVVNLGLDELPEEEARKILEGEEE